ncbi:MAG: two-component sensor histidine kinase [Treponema sp.]|nr:two-component sensor histidine kinase [Treponema sp.]
MRDYVKRVSQMLPKLSEEQIKQIIKSVASENEMLDSIIDSLSTGLMVVNNDWFLLKVNNLAERYLKEIFVNDDINPGKNPEPIYNLLNESEICDFLKECAREDKTNVSQEFSTTNSSGSIRFVQVSIFSWIYDGQMKGRIIKFYDITEKRSQEVLLRRMENMAGLTNLAAGMAHEIKNPLGAIGIHIQLIQRAVKKERELGRLSLEKKFLEDHLDIVNEEIENLNKLVMNFLFAVRPVKASLELKCPEALINNIVSFFAPEFEKSKVALSYTPCKKKNKFPRLLIDEKLFREVLINILQNAFAAIKEKQSEMEDFTQGIIEIKSELKDDNCLLFISDNGSGMSEDTLSHIFEPYFTTKASGTGLGMTMVYKIIKEFGGDISVTSTKGIGTEFTISLPVPQTDKKLLSEGFSLKESCRE